ncbi:MAG: hypothetical protein IJ005_05110 [Bacteroidales bacterium]|nr:hypothetical protein [Bacteroidales bacterium]
MILIVESGATKTAWRAVAPDGTVRQAQTAGLSPTCIDADYIREVVGKVVPELNPAGVSVSQVFFYGAGLVSSESAAVLADVVGLWCPFAHIEFHSDILAAGRALFGDGSGVVAVMGTGSNSCLYEKGEVVRNIRPGGFILGDEGSGVCLGRLFLSDYIKGLIPKTVGEAFESEFGLDYPQIVRKVYRENGASAFMASLAPFILNHIHEPYVESLVDGCIESFVVRALSRYAPDASDPSSACKVGVVGSFGCACRDRLVEIGSRYGLEFVRFLKSPVDELVKYHMQ